MSQVSQRVFITICIVFSSLIVLVCLCRDPFLHGPDAYYYALQAKYWALTGSVKIPDTSPIHRIVGTIHLTGLSIEKALCMWVAVSLLIAGLGAAAMKWANGAGYTLFDAIVLALLLASPPLLFIAIEFPKMMSAMMLVPLWFLPLVWREKYWPFSILIALFGTLLHASIIPIVLLFSVALLVVHFRQIAKHRIILIGATLLVTALILGSLPYLKMSPLLLETRLPGNQWTVGAISLLAQRNLPWAIRIEFATTFALFLIILTNVWTCRTQKRKYIFLTVPLILPAFVPLKGGGAMSVAERYAIVAPYLLLTATIYLSSLLPGSSTPLSFGKKMILATIFTLIVLATPLRLKLSHPAHLDPNYVESQQAVRELSNKQIPMLVAHKSFAYFYKYTLMREAFPYDPEAHWNKTRIWRATYHIEPEEFDYYLGESCKWDSGLLQPLANGHYCLIREDCWEEMRTRIKADMNEDLFYRAWETTLNPSARRPSFLYLKHAKDAFGEFSAYP